MVQIYARKNGVQHQVLCRCGHSWFYPEYRADDTGYECTTCRVKYTGKGENVQREPK
ncbi:hypothetical protein HWC07_gp033 [Pantoea phage vB_PagM_LIET2]|uniref:Uncharacterized protein n=1 Tax=Pantoea phage vB_PagM_LIET2 TaxID=2508071 RepID=A0A411AW37_9CAUD|nr:hypothetical protein HWC07_gp033 [Pantoea phage vB_PagM_LIET2]QAX92285.1 hypothetical protein LIET2_gp033 [Pantoea phage vB_PagM_LIET2]